MWEKLSGGDSLAIDKNQTTAKSKRNLYIKALEKNSVTQFNLQPRQHCYSHTRYRLTFNFDKI